jgi:acyl-CoA synthetase (AMP-forming)/AMP-acid ligase II
MISHRNVISNVLQISTYESKYRQMMQEKSGSKAAYLETTLGLLPQSHIYSLVVICHATGYRGDRVINLPKFEIKSFLEAIQRFKITTLILVSLWRATLVLCN